MNWIESPDRSALIESVVGRVREHLDHCLTARSEACMALAGGSTPLPIYARLAGTDLDWSCVSAVPTDERWVATAHAANNARQIRQQFAGSGLRVHSLVPDDANGAANPQSAEQVLAALPSPFDLVLVGMGSDAHFASLFPLSAALSTGLDPSGPAAALAVLPDPLPAEAPFARITLSLSKLLQTRCLLLVITGQTKRETLMRAAQADADEHQQPIAALLRAAGDRLEIFWSP